MSSPPPQFLGRYELGPELGSGGSAVVYLARSTDARQRASFAIKVLHAHMRETAAQELLQEARLAGSIDHPNVVRVLEVSDEPAGVYLLMEYVDGDTLSGLMRHPLPPAADRAAHLSTGIALRVLLDALEGLQAAHELHDAQGGLLGLVHRDFTPQNVLVGKDGQTKLSDFGTAKAANALQRTRTGQVKGKVAYMAPEQVRGLPLDRRCDVWAAGVMAWEILAGHSLHKDADEVQIMFKVVSETPPLLREARPDIPAGLEQVVARALQLDPEARWSTATALQTALSQAWTQAYGPLPRSEDVARGVAFAREHRPRPPPTFPAPGGAPNAPDPRALGRPWRMATVAGLAVLAASVLAGLLGLSYGSTRRTAGVAAPVTPAQARPALVATASLPPVLTPARTATSSATAVAAPPLPTPPAHTREATTKLSIVSSEPVTRLRVDEQWRPVGEPSRQLQLSIPAQQSQRGFLLSAINAKGQTAELRVAPGARTARLEFGAAPPSELRPRPPLADNPYGDPP